jgi:hypothetical protein
MLCVVVTLAVAVKVMANFWAVEIMAAAVTEKFVTVIQQKYCTAMEHLERFAVFTCRLATIFSWIQNPEGVILALTRRNTLGQLQGAGYLFLADNPPNRTSTNFVTSKFVGSIKFINVDEFIDSSSFD